MKPSLLFPIYLTFFVQLSFAQEPFQKRIWHAIDNYSGQTGHTKGITLLQTSDGNLLVGGKEWNRKAKHAAYLVKTNQQGEALWTHSYDEVIFSTLIETSDKGFAILGNSTEGAILIKTNPQGEPIWARKYHFLYDAHLVDLKQTQEGGFIFIGHQNFLTNESIVVKTTPDGFVQWAKGLESSSLKRAINVLEITGSGYLISGLGKFPSGGLGDLYLVKLDLSGDFQWAKLYGGSKNEVPQFMLQMSDGGIIIGGASESFNSRSLDVFIIKVDTTGNLLWSRDWDMSSLDYVFDGVKTADGGLAVFGMINVGVSDYAPTMLKVSAEGEVEWAKKVDTERRAFTGGQTTDKGYALLIKKNHRSARGIYLTKTDALGNSCASESVQVTTIPHQFDTISHTSLLSDIELTVNTLALTTRTGGIITDVCGPSSHISPTFDDHHITLCPNPIDYDGNFYTDKLFQDATLTIYNFHGQVAEQIFHIQGVAFNYCHSDLSPGLYIYRITEGGQLLGSGKMVIR